MKISVSSRLERRKLSALLFVLAGAEPCIPGQVTYNASAPAQLLPWTGSVVLPRFDPSLGFLREATVQVNGYVQGTVGVENTNAGSSGTGSYAPVARIIAMLPAGGLPGAPNPAYEALQFQSLPAFDGTLDYGGTSGTTINFGPSGGTGAPSMSAHIYWGAGLLTYTGPSGAPGTFTVNLDASDTTSSAPPGIATTLSLQASANVNVTYDFDTAPARFCSGNPPSFTACPCGNNGSPPNGCGNSVNSQGAALTGAGQASLASDTFVLSAGGMPNSSALFFQGDDFVYNGSMFGDGLLCLQGSLIRLGTKTNAAGASQYPETGNALISVRGQIGAPGPRYYQTWYRNAASFCTSATSNVTNGLSVLWMP